MDKTIRFENGSKIEILPAKEPKRSKRSEEQMKQIYLLFTVFKNGRLC